MADRGDTHYFRSTLHRWFALSSVVLLISVFWMVIHDWNRPWKQVQREFNELDAKLARETLEQESMQAAADSERRLSEIVAQREEQLERASDAIDEAEAELRKLKDVRMRAEEAAKMAKQVYNWEKYLYEEHRLHGGVTEEETAALVEYEDEFHTTAKTFEEADADYVAQQGVLADLRRSVTDAELNLKNATKDLELVRRRLNKLDPEAPAEQLANLVRDFPGLDFVDPKYKVRKVLPPDLTFELNFTKGRRIDMCETCHLGIERKGFEAENGIEQPWHSTTPNAPHQPMLLVGRVMPPAPTVAISSTAAPTAVM